MEKFVYYNGYKFTRDDKTGYYLNSTLGKRLHRYVWECNYGEIPEGYCIHHQGKEFVCLNCGETFIGVNNGANKFCSNKCKSAYRRKLGLDNVKCICICCGKEFTTNKYSKAKYCSQSCSNKAEPRLPQLREKNRQ